MFIIFLIGSRRGTDSISDILAAFPVPATGNQDQKIPQRLSAWPLPSEYDGDGRSIGQQARGRRKFCGLPIWAFILLIILALLVIAAAVVVPLQLVNLSRNQDGSETNTNNTSLIIEQCKQKTVCQNGGKVVATQDFCGCICTDGFSGKTCSVVDNSCATMDLEDMERLGTKVDGIHNATIGAAVKRLLEISEPQYNLKLDASKIISNFWAGGLSCAAQNALVTFNGQTAPETAETTRGLSPNITPTPQPQQRKKRQDEETDIVYDTRPPPDVTGPVTPLPTPTQQPAPDVEDSLPQDNPEDTMGTGAPANRTPALDEDAIEFARVSVLFIVQVEGLTVAIEAQEKLQKTFTRGIDYGLISVGNNIVVNLNSNTIEMPQA